MLEVAAVGRRVANGLQCDCDFHKNLRASTQVRVQEGMERRGTRGFGRASGPNRPSRSKET